MRRIAIAVMGTVSGLVLLFSYHTSLGQGNGAQGGDDGTALTADNGSSTGVGGDSGETSAAPSAGAGQSQKGGGTSGTFTGDRAQTRWGPVRVRIVVRNGKIIKAQAIEFPNENHHDVEINSVAIPRLQDATVQANSAQIDSVSGATVTSGGYISSLQSAVDKAHL
jgi:uncharacterized protein with FMN-binding domain